MQAVILVGGEGTRLRPLTYDLPKPMVPIFGRPYLEHLIELLKKHNIFEIILSSGYKVEEIEQYFKNGSQFGVKIFYAVETTPLGTAGAIKNAEKFIKDTFLVFNGDIMTDIDLTAFLRMHKKYAGLGTLSLYSVEDPSAFGLIETDINGRITAFIEKPKPEDITTNYINAGVYILEKKILEFIPEKINCSIERKIYPELLKSNYALYSFKFDTYWIDIGSPQKYMKVHTDAINKKYELIFNKKEHAGIYMGNNISLNGAKIMPPVFLDDNFSAGNNVILGPMAIIGKNCAIKDNITIKDSLIWENTNIDNGSKIINSIIGRNCNIKRNSTIENQVIGSYEEIKN